MVIDFSRRVSGNTVPGVPPAAAGNSAIARRWIRAGGALDSGG